MSEVASLLARGALRQALAALNARTRFRFTGVYRFEPPLLRGVEIFDRENPALALRAVLPIRETYCGLILDAAHDFSIADASRDRRVAEHPAREVHRAYCGAPLRHPDGSVFGTLCHYDPRPRIDAASELAVLVRLAPLVTRLLLGD